MNEAAADQLQTHTNIHTNSVTCVIKHTTMKHTHTHASEEHIGPHLCQRSIDPHCTFCPAVKRLSGSLQPLVWLTLQRFITATICWLRPEICPKYLDHVVRLARGFCVCVWAFAPFPTQSITLVICWVDTERRRFSVWFLLSHSYSNTDYILSKFLYVLSCKAAMIVIDKFVIKINNLQLFW